MERNAIKDVCRWQWERKSRSNYLIIGCRIFVKNFFDQVSFALSVCFGSIVVVVFFVVYLLLPIPKLLCVVLVPVFVHVKTKKYRSLSVFATWNQIPIWSNRSFFFFILFFYCQNVQAFRNKRPEDNNKIIWITKAMNRFSIISIRRSEFFVKLLKFPTIVLSPELWRRKSIKIGR